ncbi:hypothetical protein [Halioxenophilus aromaticivorans]|uniref:Uncharacterized protein n=1 Tax=Halioxenophilus aromaticivorans TaxID=1306992 RepID=A0AAV3TZQ9_9ALTE
MSNRSTRSLLSVLSSVLLLVSLNLGVSQALADGFTTTTVTVIDAISVDDTFSDTEDGAALAGILATEGQTAVTAQVVEGSHLPQSKICGHTIRGPPHRS